MPADNASAPPPPPPRAELGIGRSWVITPLLLLVFWSMLALQPAPRDGAGVRWQGAQLLALQDALTGEPRLPRPVDVQLPHSWQPSGLPAKGVGRYQLLLTVSETDARDAAIEPWALRIDRLSPAHRVWLNGQLVHSTLPRPGWLTLAAPYLLDLPTGALRTGTNTLDIELHCAGQCGLTPVTLARKGDLQGAFSVYEWITRDMVVALNIVCITFSLFIVMLWWLRRQEAAAGLFGLFIAVGGLRNCRYFIEGDLHLSANLDSWLYFVAHVVATCLQSWFVMALTGTRWPALHRLLCAVLIGFPLIAWIAMHWDPGLTHTRNIMQGPLLLLLPPSMWMIMRSGASIPGNLLFGMGIGWFIALLASIHDFLLGRLVGDVSFSFWLPWAIPMMTPQFVAMVVKRIVHAFNEIEEVNQRLEVKVAERTRELAAANAAKSHFIASASHDLRQPVAAIGLITDLLQSRVSDPALRSLTDRLTRAVHSMESLLKGLLDLSRLDSGTVEVQRRRVHLQTLLDAVTSHEAEAARQKGLQLRVRRTRALVWTDPVLLEQVLRNLVGNAIRHTQRGGVLVGVRRRRGQWEVQVWDTGPGIHPHDQPRIFEAFVQLGNPGRERAQGLGLGLAIVQRAAQLLSHPLRVRSLVGRGSCFAVSLPAATMVLSTLSKASQDDTAFDFSDRRVLVIEDDEALRETLVLSLRTWGLEAVPGHSLAWVKSQAPSHWDLVISDHRLPDGNGRDVIQHLRQHQPELPAVIVTGDTSPQQLAELAASGLPVLHKPFRAEKLRAMLAESMARPDRSKLT